MMSGGYSGLYMVWHILGWVASIAIIVWLFRFIFRGGRRGRFMDMHDAHDHPHGLDRSHTILRERYAKGELTKEQYESMKKDLE